MEEEFNPEDYCCGECICCRCMVTEDGFIYGCDGPGVCKDPGDTACNHFSYRGEED